MIVDVVITHSVTGQLQKLLNDTSGVLFPRLASLEVKRLECDRQMGGDVKETLHLLGGPSLVRVYIDLLSGHAPRELRGEILSALSPSQNVQTLHLYNWTTYQAEGEDINLGLFPNLQAVKTDFAISRASWVNLEHHPRLQSISIRRWTLDLPWPIPYSITLVHLRTLQINHSVATRVVTSLLLHTRMPSLTMIRFNLHESFSRLDGLSLTEKEGIIRTLREGSPGIEHLEVRLRGPESFAVLAGLFGSESVRTIIIHSAEAPFHFSPEDTQIIAGRLTNLSKMMVDAQILPLRRDERLVNSDEVVAVGGSIAHGLSIPEVRLRIFEGLPVEDLLHTSLVCKAWSELSTEVRWRSRTVRLSCWEKGLLERLNQPSQRWRQLVSTFPRLSLASACYVRVLKICFHM